MNAHYADFLALLINTSAPYEFLLFCQKQIAGGIGLYVNLDKIF